MDVKVERHRPQDDESYFDVNCSDPLPLGKIKVGAHDKLGHQILDVLWCGSDYAVYRSERGVYVHFSDDPEHASKQRAAFTGIAPELCELRVFTNQMRQTPNFGSRWLTWLTGSDDSTLYDHNIAQALMLTMEHKIDPAKAIAKAALAMAVRRTTNDNTIRYVVTCVQGAAAWIFLATCGLMTLHLLQQSPLLQGYLMAAIFGAVGAVFSIITRVEAFEMKPCQQSNMNVWMSGIRVCIGIIGGVMLLLLGRTLASGSIVNIDATKLLTWEFSAALGFMGGFSERLVKSLLRRTSEVVVLAPGTPVQEARRLEDTANR